MLCVTHTEQSNHKPKANRGLNQFHYQIHFLTFNYKSHKSSLPSGNHLIPVPILKCKKISELLTYCSPSIHLLFYFLLVDWTAGGLDYTEGPRQSTSGPLYSSIRSSCFYHRLQTRVTDHIKQSCSRS